MSVISTNPTSYLLQSAQISSSGVSTLVNAPLDTTQGNSYIETTMMSTKWGFKVDQNGFFGADFNKVAEIPENVKINQQMLEGAEKYAQNLGTNLDPIASISKIWDFFSAISGNTLDSDGDGLMTLKQVKSMPLSYVTDGSMLDSVVSVQKSFEENMEVNSVYNNIGYMSNNTLDTGLRSFLGMNFSVTENIADIKDTYKSMVGVNYDQSEDTDKISVGELFGIFVNGEYGTETEVDKIKSYYSLLDSGQSLKSYLTDTFGADYMKQLAINIGTMPDGKFIPDMLDTLFDAIDKTMKKQYAEHKAKQADSIASTTDNSVLNSLSQNYQAAKIAKLPMGSLISIEV